VNSTGGVNQKGNEALPGQIQSPTFSKGHQSKGVQKRCPQQPQGPKASGGPKKSALQVSPFPMSKKGTSNKSIVPASCKGQGGTQNTRTNQSRKKNQSSKGFINSGQKGRPPHALKGVRGPQKRQEKRRRVKGGGRCSKKRRLSKNPKKGQGAEGRDQRFQGHQRPKGGFPRRAFKVNRFAKNQKKKPPPSKGIRAFRSPQSIIRGQGGTGVRKGSHTGVTMSFKRREGDQKGKRGQGGGQKRSIPKKNIRVKGKKDRKKMGASPRGDQGREAHKEGEGKGHAPPSKQVSW